MVLSVQSVASAQKAAQMTALEPMRPTVAVILAHMQPGRTTAAVAFVASAHDEESLTWGPPQGPVLHGELQASAVALLKRECGVTALRVHQESLFSQNNPHARGGGKHFTWLLYFTNSGSLRPGDPSVKKVRWVYGWEDMQAMLGGASPQKRLMVERAIRQSARLIGWQVPD